MNKHFRKGIKWNKESGHKFMQVLSKSIFKQLKEESDKRGVSVQEYIRVIVIPAHLETIHPKVILPKSRKRSIGAARGWVKRKMVKEPIINQTPVVPVA